MSKVVGVLALQGSFAEHIDCLEACVRENGHNVEVIAVKTQQELARCDSLIIPGGESTAISQIAERTGLHEHLYQFVRTPGKSAWGTCAGLIFLSNQVANQAALLKPLGILDVTVERNAFGRQLQSFEKDCDFSSFWDHDGPFPTVFIRAPVISKINSKNVEVLYTLQRDDGSEQIVAVRQGSILGTSFHPELGSDTRFHDWFLRTFVL